MTILDTEVSTPSLPVDANIRYSVEVSFRCAITPQVARQNANVYLLMHIGNMLSADDPTLVLSEQPYWKTPIFCAFPEFNRREKIGELAVDIESGAILMAHSFPASVQEIVNRVEQLYDSLDTSSTGT